MKWSAGDTVNLNWPFLLSNRNKIDLDGAMMRFLREFGEPEFRCKPQADGHERKDEES